MAQDDIAGVVDHLRRIKSRGDLNSVKIETLEMELRFLRTFLKYHHAILPDLLVKIRKKAKLIVEMLHSVFDGNADECKTNVNVERLKSRLLEFMIEDDTTSLRFNYVLDDSYLSDDMCHLDMNLSDALRYLVKSDPILAEEIKILRKTNRSLKQLILTQKKMRSQNGVKGKLRILKELIFAQKKMRLLRYLYVREIKGYVAHEKLKGLQMQIQFMVENVGHFCLALWFYDADSYSEEDEDDADSEEDSDSYSEEDEEDAYNTKLRGLFTRVAEPVLDTPKMHYFWGIRDVRVDIFQESKQLRFNIQVGSSKLLFLVVLVELEMKKIFLSELKASKFTQSRTFKDKKLPKEFSYHLHSLLVYLRNKNLENFPDNISAQNIDVAIEFLLVFLSDVPNCVINGKRLNEDLEKIAGLVGEVLCANQVLLAGSTIKEVASKIDLSMIQIMEKIEDLKAQVETYYKSLKYNPSQFPTVGGLSFLDSLLRKLNEMLKSESSLDLMMKPHLGILEKEFSSLTSAFRDVKKVQHEHDEILKDLQKRTINLAYESEIAIDSILVQYNTLFHFSCSLPAIIKELKHISVKVREMRFQNLPLKPCYVVEPSKHQPIQHNSLMNDEEIVGFENDIERIMKHLIQGTNKLHVLPIVGMGGQGKTTCARKLYNNEIIICHFDVRAWCVISQTYNRRELLQQIFSQVIGSKDKVDDVGKLADLLRRHLMGKRYLIVLDDMWDCMAWDDLWLSFPDVGNKSRIVVTTRLEKVGEHVMRHIKPYFLPFLTPYESLKLLQKRVFQQESCPPELQDASQAVAEGCKGLPLVVVLVAGIIKKRKMEASWWDEVKHSLFSYLGESEGYSLSTMQLSYDNLPDYLKPCLLYMGMFPEDEIIPVSRLISLWSAEGFVQNIETGRSVAEAAEGYLMDLISSNVVMVSKRAYNGKVKYCQVHDIVIHFCLEKSREEKFMLAMKDKFRPLDCNEIRVSLSFRNEFSEIANKANNLRSLMTTTGLLSERDFRQIHKLRLLKVLDLIPCTWNHFSLAALESLIHLKYLSVNAAKFDLHLPHLETLIMRKLTLFPAEVVFRKMEKLRRVEIRPSFYWRNYKESSTKLENLRILRGIEVSIDEADSMDVLLWRCPNLEEVDITFKGSGDSSDNICPKLESLIQLQILRLGVKQYSPSISELHLPSNLKRLSLDKIRTESTISVIAGLPCLEHLELQFPFFPGRPEEWCLGDITFHKLKKLKLVASASSKWSMSEESFPQLETLVLSSCFDLKEIPLSFADVLTLKKIKLSCCGNVESLKASVARIKECIVENEGRDRLDLIIRSMLK